MDQPKKHAVVEVPPYLATYVKGQDNRWTGGVRELGAIATGDTLEEARAALQAAVAAKIRTFDDDQFPAGIHKGALTVADRMEGHVYRNPFGDTLTTGATSRPTTLPRRSPYIAADGSPRLLPSVVLVIDELGATSRMITGLTDDVLAERITILQRARDWLGSPETAFFESVVVYTDNLVHGAPVTEYADPSGRLGMTINAASFYQLELALSGTILRGGITLGDHHQSESLVAGPALIEAHHLESKVAVFPRIVLSDATLEAVAQGISEGSPFDQQLLVDEDDQLFVSYLNVTEDYDGGPADQLKLLGDHRDVILRGLADTQSQARPHAKWQWLADYHDHYVRANNLPNVLLVRRPGTKRRRFQPLPRACTEATTGS
jgi:hypothetical protein